jgi:hypothetical protein
MALNHMNPSRRLRVFFTRVEAVAILENLKDVQRISAPRAMLHRVAVGAGEL